MSSIKPPSGKSPGLTSPTDVAGKPATKAPSETFRKTLEEPSAAGSASATAPSTAAAGVEPKKGAAGIAQELRAGKIDAETAVNKLVDKALAKADAAGLPPAKRTELEAMLRDALESDPTLSQLSKDLERGR